jgi:hypothetical protein
MQVYKYFRRDLSIAVAIFFFEVSDRDQTTLRALESKLRPGTRLTLCLTESWPGVYPHQQVSCG